MNETAFNDWWDTPYIPVNNPYTPETPAWWSWEAWQAATKVERKWVGLTDEDILNEQAKKQYVRTQFADKAYGIALDTVTVVDFARAIETKLKEKNT